MADRRKRVWDVLHGKKLPWVLRLRNRAGQATAVFRARSSPDAAFFSEILRDQAPCPAQSRIRAT